MPTKKTAKKPASGPRPKLRVSKQTLKELTPSQDVNVKGGAAHISYAGRCSL